MHPSKQNIVPAEYWLSLFKRTDRPHYVVAGQPYYNKLHAIFETKKISQQLNISPWQILKFSCFDSLADYDFSAEPVETYQELCIQRAKQLRDKYSHIRLYYSGGVDSHTTLRSFYLAGLHIDEIIVIKNATVGDDTPSNIETTQVVVPNLGKIQAWFPKAKIKLLDYVFDVDVKNNADTVEWRSRMTRLVPGWHLTRNPSTAFDIDNTLLSAFDKSSHCELVGEPKPNIVRKNGKWYTYMVDNQLEGVLTLPGLELFHFSADFPKIYIKQCHMLMKQYELLMVNQSDSYSLELTKDFNQKNMFTERYNEWDVNQHSRHHNEFAKKIGPDGEQYAMKQLHSTMIKDPYFAQYYQQYQTIYQQEIYEPYSEFFNDGKNYKSYKGVLSKFWNLSAPGSSTVDELWPLGFGKF